jgi:hypothetical protein
MSEIQDLVGRVSQETDLLNIPKRLRFQERSVLNSSSVFRITLPRVADDHLDCRSIRLRFNFNFLNKSATGFSHMENSASCIIERLRIICGSTVLQDTSEYNTLVALHNNVRTSADEAGYDRYMEGRESYSERALYADGREFIIPFLKGSLLNSECLLPLSRLNDLHIEITLAHPSKCLWQTDSTKQDLDYQISNVQLLYSMIRSPSISSWFNSNGVQFHIKDYQHRYANVQDQKALVRFSSSHQNLDSIVTLVRQQSFLSNINRPGKFDYTDSAANIEKTNMFINGQLFYEEDISSPFERWVHMKSVYPDIKNSEFFNSEKYGTNGHVICNRLASAPHRFTHLLSGTKTSSLNSDVVLKLDLVATPPETLVATSFLTASALVYLDPVTGGRGDLKIRY